MKEFTAVIVLILALLSAAVYGMFKFAHAQCDNVAEATGKRTAWYTAGGCFVENHGEMIPFDTWKTLNVRVTQ